MREIEGGEGGRKGLVDYARGRGIGAAPAPFLLLFYVPCSSSMLLFCSFLYWYGVVLPRLISALVSTR